MKKHLAVLATIALLGVIAKADDKGTEFKFGGEVVQRYENQQQANLLSGGNGSTSSDFLSRNQFHINAISSDKLQAYFDLIHTALWGATNNVPSQQYPVNGGTQGATPNNGGTGSMNALQVSEAWLWWKMSDMISLRSGRQSMDYGDGLVFSKNDWLATPYNVDGVMARMSWDFLDLDLGGGVLADFGPGNALTSGAVTDSEIVFYGFYASLKNLPDVLKKGELFVMQVNEDGGLPGASQFIPAYVAGAGSLGLTAIGIHLKGDVSIIDYRADGVYETGKQKAAGTGAQAGQDVTITGSMIDLEVGANFPEFMKARVFANYHTDTGNSSTNTSTNNAYQPLFYDRHTYAGLMDTIGFGNLTDIRLGAKITPMEDTTFGLEYNILSRTSTGANAGITWLAASEGNNFAGSTSALGTGAPGALPPSLAANLNTGASDLGSEIALNASHNYGHGFSMYGQLAFWSPGGYFKGTGNNIGSPWQLIAQAKYAF